MIKPKAAIKKVVQTTPGPFFELLPIEKCAGRYLGEDLYATVDLPPFDNSSVDGYALRSRDTYSASTTKPVRLKIVGEIYAGETPGTKLSSGECCWIATGAKIPEGCDAVVMFEEVREKDGYIEVKKPVKKWQNVRKRGFELKQGRLILKKGTLLTPASVGLASTAGHLRAVVGAKPSVHIIVTGEELVTPGEGAGEGKVFDANGPALKTFFHYLHLDPHLHRSGDNLQALLKVLKKIDTSVPSVVLISGGASVGKRDFTRVALLKIGVEEVFWKVAQKPGKPLLFGVKENTAFFALPGNPASALACTYLYAATAVRKMMGAGKPEPLKIKGVLKNKVQKIEGRTQFLRGQLSLKNGSPLVQVFREQRSSVLTTFARANALVEIPPGAGSVPEGSTVNVYPLGMLHQGR